MNKREAKKQLNQVLLHAPKGMDLNDYVFCCARHFDYGGKRYKGIPLYYFNVIKDNYIYLVPKQNYESLWIRG